jgi:hypothetical protein
MSNINLYVSNTSELNQKVTEYQSKGFKIETSTNKTVVMKKKGYSTALLIILILFLVIGAIIYYVLSKDEIVTISISENNQN